MGFRIVFSTAVAVAIAVLAVVSFGLPSMTGALLGVLGFAVSFWLGIKFFPG